MDDPAKKQYVIFSFILGIIISFMLNFFFSSLIEGPFFSGFPVAVASMTGIGAFVGRLVNTMVLGAFLTVPIYYGILWLQNRGGY